MDAGALLRQSDSKKFFETIVGWDMVKRALLLDRDGVINEDRRYVHRIEEFQFLDGIFDVCRAAAAVGMAIIVVTNQAGIGRGIFTEQQFHLLTDWMIARFAEQGVKIDQVYFCPHHPEHGVGHYKCDCFCRKPNPGMILQARDDHNLCLRNSVMVGDKEWDIVAAKTAGVGTTVLVSGSSVEDLAQKPEFHLRSLNEVIPALFRARLL
jgi:D-glycero-D-manno-heptose 1,7-bisphosphate phosphatase